MSENNVNSTTCFKLIWAFMSILGVWRDEPKSVIWKGIRVIYATIIISLVTIFYPLHLLMVTFRLPTTADNLKNLALAVALALTSVKYFYNIYKMPKIFEMENILRQLDKRVIDEDERIFFHTKIRKDIRNIILGFSVIYVPIGLIGELAFLLRSERTLMYAAWFPFDWEHSDRNYLITNWYQFIGLCLQILKSLNNELLPVFSLCVAAGHARLLGIRVSKIGHKDPHNYEKNEKELLDCVMDQKTLYRLFDVMQDYIAWPMFLQILANVMNIGISLALLLFYVEEPAEKLFYVFYSFGVPLQIFPACFYGTYVQLCMGRLSNAAFNSNWLTQRQKFKRHMLLFVERTLKPNMMLAGGMLNISIETFFAVCRMAYSIFAVLVQR